MPKNSPRSAIQAFYSNSFPIIIISCLGILVYSNTFFCSFHFDDFRYIVSNPSIRNIHDLHSIWAFLPSRFILNFSNALNYHFNGLHVWGYHLFNLAVHLTSAILVWWLTLLTLSTPVMKGNKITEHAPLIALFAGLLFVSHPVQTEAVTYIVQRAASMATLFFVASVCFYVRSRLLQDGLRARIYYICALIMAVAAMFTKETAITLPLTLLLYEFSFFRTKGNFNWMSLIPFLLTLFIIPVTMLCTQPLVFQKILHITHKPATGITATQYLLTQLRVMLTFIRLVFLPLNQNLDYDYPVSSSIFELPALFSFLFLSIVLFLAKQLFSKYRVLAFSIFWFFLTLLPVSGLLPVQDVIYEHRLYLPLVGYSIFLVSGVYYLLGKNAIQAMIIVLTMIVTVNSMLTYQRNKVWENEFTLWDDVVRKSPHKARPYDDRGIAYAQQGKFMQAMADFNTSIEIDPRDAKAYCNRANIYSHQGNFIQAMLDYSKVIDIDQRYAEAYNNRGIIYAREGDFTRALSDLDQAIVNNPSYASAYYNRGLIYAKEGNFIRANADYSKAAAIDPKYARRIS